MNEKIHGDEERAAHDVQWYAGMREHVVPRQLLKPLVAFEEQLRIAEPLLNPEARQTKSFVARFSERPDADETRASFEQIVDAAEQVCRHWRKEKSRSAAYYEQAVLQPKLDLLAAPPRDEKREALLSSTAAGKKLLAQRKMMDQLHATLKEYANGFGEKVNADKLWNAYRLDFRKMDTAQLNAHPFVQAFPATMQVLRPLARVYRLEKTLRAIQFGSQEGIIAQAVKLRAMLPANDVLRIGTLGAQLDTLADGVPHPFAHQLFSEQEEQQAEAAEANFIRTMKQYAGAMREEIEAQNRHFGKAGHHAGLRVAYNAQFQQELLDAYKADVKALRKKDANGDVTNQQEINDALRSAKHIEPLISYLRAQAALKKFDQLVEKSSRSIIGMYDAPLQGRTD